MLRYSSASWTSSRGLLTMCSRGYTLLEVLVALTLFMMFIATYSKSQQLMLRRFSGGERELVALHELLSLDKRTRWDAVHVIPKYDDGLAPASCKDLEAKPPLEWARCNRDYKHHPLEPWLKELAPLLIWKPRITTP